MNFLLFDPLQRHFLKIVRFSFTCWWEKKFKMYQVYPARTCTHSTRMQTGQYFSLCAKQLCLLISTCFTGYFFFLIFIFLKNKFQAKTPEIYNPSKCYLVPLKSLFAPWGHIQRLKLHSLTVRTYHKQMRQMELQHPVYLKFFHPDSASWYVQPLGD